VTDFILQQDSRIIRPLERQIDVLSDLIQQDKSHQKFPAELENEYEEFRRNQMVAQDMHLISAGLIVFLVFSWAELYMTGGRSISVFIIRCLITFGCFVALYMVPRTRLLNYGFEIVALGAYICFLTLLWQIVAYADDPNRYLYHLGIIPMLVFMLLSLRNSYRMMMVASLSMLASYVIVLLSFRVMGEASPYDNFARQLTPFYLLFLLIQIAMNTYLSYVIESGSRSEFVKNRLLALEAQRLQYLGQRLQQLSTTDGLTGIANRRYLEEKLASEWARGVRSQQQLALIMLDVDYFKDFNDAYGHQAGDECLRLVTGAIRVACRRHGDFCARYGGEEFVVVLPDTSEDDALLIADEIRQRVMTLEMEHATSEFGLVTVSLGVAAAVPAKDGSYENLLRLADMALYQSKDSGRNQVTAAAALDA
tara:strand:+ start:16752 stop:18020 length:1269 start_codon:yes stop_codon:yes gene_type:complete